MKRFLVSWEAHVIAGNPKVNPGVKDRKTVRCMGETLVTDATSADHIRDRWRQLFPDTRILRIT